MKLKKKLHLVNRSVILAVNDWGVNHSHSSPRFSFPFIHIYFKKFYRQPKKKNMKGVYAIFSRNSNYSKFDRTIISVLKRNVQEHFKLFCISCLSATNKKYGSVTNIPFLLNLFFSN